MTKIGRIAQKIENYDFKIFIQILKKLFIVGQSIGYRKSVLSLYIAFNSYCLCFCERFQQINTDHFIDLALLTTPQFCNLSVFLCLPFCILLQIKHHTYSKLFEITQNIAGDIQAIFEFSLRLLQQNLKMYHQMLSKCHGLTNSTGI